MQKGTNQLTKLTNKSSKMYEIDQIYALRGKSPRSNTFFGKIPGSWDFAKSHPGNPGIENFF